MPQRSARLLISCRPRPRWAVTAGNCRTGVPGPVSVTPIQSRPASAVYSTATENCPSACRTALVASSETSSPAMSLTSVGTWASTAVTYWRASGTERGGPGKERLGTSGPGQPEPAGPADHLHHAAHRGGRAARGDRVEVVGEPDQHGDAGGVQEPQPAQVEVHRLAV